MKPVSLLVCLALLTAALAFVPRPASAAEELVYPTSVVAAPGVLTNGIAAVQTSDDDRASTAEADTTANLNALAWLKPNGDVSVNQLAVGCLQAASWGCVDDDPVHDGNGTYLVSAVSRVAYHSLADWPGPSDVTFDSVTRWHWIRGNGTTQQIDTNIRVETPLNACTPSSLSLTQAFANYSATEATVCITGVAWTATTIDDITILSATAAIRYNVTTTAAGLTVQYDDRDFNVAMYLNFTSLPSPGGYDYVLDYEGYEDLLTETAALQVLRDGGWTTIATMAAGADATGTYTVLAEESDTGSVSFRIIDSSTDEETGESVYVDLFRITATPHTIVDPGGNVLQVTCAFAWPDMDLRCRAKENLDPAFVTLRVWFIDGVEVARSEDSAFVSLVWDVGEPAYAPFTKTYNVSFRVVTTGGGFLEDSVFVVADTSWLWAVYALVAFVIVALLFRRVRWEKPKGEGPPPRKE